MALIDGLALSTVDSAERGLHPWPQTLPESLETADVKGIVRDALKRLLTNDRTSAPRQLLRRLQEQAVIA